MGECSEFFFDGKNDSSTLHNRISIENSLLEIARTKRDDLLAFLKPRLSSATGYEVKYWLQGSYKNHTLIREASKGQEFDIDVGVYLFCNAEKEDLDALGIKNLNREILQEFSQIDLGAIVKPSKKNCERVAYAPTFHLDIPLYYYDEETDICRLATESHGWVDSDPKAMQDWFDQAVLNLNANELARLRRVIRYLKMWVSLKWKDPQEKKIPSLAITLLVAQYFQNADDDESAFIETVSNINDYLQQRFEVKSPINGDDILDFTSNEIEIAKERFQSLANAGKYICHSKEIFKSYLIWSSVFEHMFPPYSEHSFSNETTKNLPALSNPPTISIRHLDKSKKNVISNGIHNSIIACKQEHLYFSIINQSDYSAHSEVKWMIRNQGMDAGRVNDMGHMQNTNINEVAYEVCAYDGTHFVECMIFDGSSIVGFNSIKVKINGFPRPVRNPSKKSYGAK